MLTPTNQGVACVYETMNDQFGTDAGLAELRDEFAAQFAKQGITLTSIERGDPTFAAVGDQSVLIPLVVHIEGGAVPAIYEDFVIARKA